MEDMFHGGVDDGEEEEEFDFGAFAKEARAELGQWGSRAPSILKEVANKVSTRTGLSLSTQQQKEEEPIDDKGLEEVRELLLKARKENRILKQKVQELEINAKEAVEAAKHQADTIRSETKVAQRRVADLEEENRRIQDQLQSMSNFTQDNSQQVLKRTVDELQKQCTSLGHALNNALERARRAEQDAAIYKSRALKQENTPVPSTKKEIAPPMKQVVKDDAEKLRLEAKIEELGHTISTIRRERSVIAARCAKANAERDAALGSAEAAKRRAREAEERLAETIHRSFKKTEQNDSSALLIKFEETAKAAKRQVHMLDSALDAANARAAASLASRDLELAALKSRLDLTNNQLTQCKNELDRRRGNKAFYFSGQLQTELRRLELANDVLRRDHAKESSFSVADNAHELSHAAKKASVAVTSSEITNFDARARLEYVARALLRACEAAQTGDQALQSKFTPIVREVLGAPHNSVAAWFAALEHNATLVDAFQAIMDLALDALLAARSDIDSRQQIAQNKLAQTMLQNEARLAETVAYSALAFNQLNEDLNKKILCLKEDAEAQKLDNKKQIQSIRLSADQQLIVEQNRLTNLQTRHLETVASLQTHLDDARAESERLRKAISVLQAASTDATTEHARNCVLAILREGRTNGPTYSRLLPVLRTLLHQPHNVIVHNLDALITTHSGATFIEVRSYFFFYIIILTGFVTTTP